MSQPGGLQDQAVALFAAAIVSSGLSQAEFCRRAAVSTKHVNTFLKGHSGVSFAQLDYWAFILGCKWELDLSTSQDKSASE